VSPLCYIGCEELDKKEVTKDDSETRRNIF
jgi:hypothetical protein